MQASSQPVQRLRSRTTAGAAVLVASRLITRTIDLAALVVLGRLLSPADFGIVAIAMSVTAIVEATMELPLTIALVTLPVRTKAHYDTAFTLQLMRGLLLGAILVAVAWPLSQIYHDDRLIWLICALGLAPSSRGLTSPRIVEYSVDFEFLPNFVMEVAGKLVALALSVSVAWLTRSYWALVIGTIATPATMLVVSYCYAPYLPALSLKAWSDFAGYLRWTTASQAITALVWQMDQLMLGRYVNSVELGRFSMATNLSFIPSQIFVVQIVNPLVVAFSIAREDLERLKAAYQKSAASILAIGLPIMVGLSMNAELIIRLVIGQKWLAAAGILQWLALAVIPSFFVGPFTPLAITLNRTDMFVRLIVVELSIKFPLMLVGLTYWGIAGVIAVRMITSAAMAACAMWVVRALIGLKLREQLFGPWRPMMSTGVMAMSILPFKHLFASPPEFSALVMELATIVGIGVVSYLSSMFLLWSLAGFPDGLELHAVKLASGFFRRFVRRAAD